MKRIILLTAVLLGSALSSFASDDDCDTCEAYYQATNKRYENYLGVAAGTTTGYGVSVRKWFPNKLGLQVTLFPMLINETYPDNHSLSPFAEYTDETRDSGDATYGYVSLGVTALRVLGDTKYLRFLGYSGMNLYVDYKDYDYYYQSSYDDAGNWSSEYTTRHVDETSHEEQISFGLGGGIEYYVWRFSLNAMVGVVGAYKIQSHGYSLTPSFDGGLFFRF